MSCFGRRRSRRWPNSAPFGMPTASVRTGSLRVRFGEVEQRGIALTTKGRDLYDQMVAETDIRRTEAPPGTTRVDVARTVWNEKLPNTERELALQGLGVLHLPHRRRTRSSREDAPTVPPHHRRSPRFPNPSCTRTSCHVRPRASFSPT